MTRVLRTHQRITRQAIRKHRADFINARHKMFSRMSAARRWDSAYARHGEAILRMTDFAALWKQGDVL